MNFLAKWINHGRMDQKYLFQNVIEYEHLYNASKSVLGKYK